MQRLAQRLAKRPFTLLAVNVGEGKNQVRRALKLTGFGQTVLLDTDSDAYQRWGGVVLPTSYLVDRAGRIRFEAVGPLDWEGAEAAAAIEGLLSEEPPPAAASADAACYAQAPTSPTGCRP